MGNRFVRPDTVRLSISGDDWLLVKRRLTAGEQRQIFASSAKPVRRSQQDTQKPEVEIDAMQAGLSMVLAYLLDWSLTDHNDRPVVIRDQPASAVTAILDSLDFGSYLEIMEAVQTHDAAMREEREAEQRVPFGESRLLPT
jgi:hypothetical protein